MSDQALPLWETILDNAPAISIVVSLFSLLLTVYFNWIIRKRLLVSQYKLNYISEIYPPLLSDIRKCIDSYDEFKEGGAGPASNIDRLRTIIRDGRIEFIKSTNKSLYDNLMKINDDFLKQLEKLHKTRAKKHDNIFQRWGDYLENDIPYHTQFNHRDFGNHVWSATIPCYIKEDWDGIKKEYNSQLEEKLSLKPEFKSFPEGTSDRLIEIVKEEIGEILELIVEIDKFKEEIIENQVIPNMEKTIGNPI